MPDDYPREIRLTLRAEPGDVPRAVRLRKLLKYALRAVGWRCVLIDPPVVAEPNRGHDAHGSPDEPPRPQEASS